MNVIAAMLAAVGLSCCGPVYSIGGLTCPIQYIDMQRGYFLGIKDHRYTIGTALDDIKNPANDAPQVSGFVKNCSSRTFDCRSIAYLVFVIPKGPTRSSEYKLGPVIVIKPTLNGGWRGFATCSMLAKTGCVALGDIHKPVVTYQYDVSPDGVLKSIEIQNWNDQGSIVSVQKMSLKSRIGLKLN